MSDVIPHSNRTVAIIGGGPAGLMAAEVLSQHGVQVDVYDAMPSVGRKFLMAGKGGMNITHTEPLEAFLNRYGSRREEIKALLDQFTPQELREWVRGLGIDTFVGSSGRVFPTDMKAAPLLRSWLHRLRENGVSFHMRHRWTGWDEAGQLKFVTPQGDITVTQDVVILALGGGSWPQLGSDGLWTAVLQQHKVIVAPLRPSNCGFDVGWTDHFRTHFAGQPLKAVVVGFTDAAGKGYQKQGDCMLTSSGIEGGVVYALSAYLRDEIASQGHATIFLDLTPGKDMQRVHAEVAHPRGSRSMSSHLQSRVGLNRVQIGLLREVVPAAHFFDAIQLSKAIKALPIKLNATRPLAEAISSAGGVGFDSLDHQLMLEVMPGIFCAGEMLDWEAPTGGYLLTACMASGRAAGVGAVEWLNRPTTPSLQTVGV
jgi:hypothetical protein